MPYPRSKRKKLTLLWLVSMLSTLGCGTLGNQYFCPPDVAYTETGQVDTSSYRVKVDCYKSMTKKQKACYQEADD